jgi:hypothetical protein
MSGKFEIGELLNKYPLDELVKDNLARLFEFTQYLFDNDENLTKTLNLTKSAKDVLIERIQEMFEGSISEDDIRIDQNSSTKPSSEEN